MKANVQDVVGHGINSGSLSSENNILIEAGLNRSDFFYLPFCNGSDIIVEKRECLWIA